jgi:phage gpG-like protein
MGLTVNVGAFQALERKAKQLADGRFLPNVTARMGAAITKLLADEFRTSRNPYGDPWPPVFRNRGRDIRARARRSARGLAPKADRPLIDTGRLRAAAVAQSSIASGPSSVRVSINVFYAGFHQWGTRRIQQRQIVPDDSTGGLGFIWTAALNKEAIAAVHQVAREAP